jgi:DNA-binding MarR family transcriptional regulator
MRGVHNRSTGETIQLLFQENLTLPQLVALHLLDERAPLTIQEISNFLHLSLSATSQLVDSLLRKDLLVREEDPEDRRRKKVALTRKGRKLAQRLAQARTREFVRYLSDLPPDQMEEAIGVLKKMVDILHSLSNFSYGEK